MQGYQLHDEGLGYCWLTCEVQDYWLVFVVVVEGYLVVFVVQDYWLVYEGQGYQEVCLVQVYWQV